MHMQFYVPAEGVPKGSKTAFPLGDTGRSVITDSNSKPLRSYESTISAHALDHFPRPLEGPIIVEVSFVRSPRKTMPKTYRPFVTSAPDGDKMIRAVLDGLQGFAYVNDSQVVKSTSEKFYPHGDFYTHPGTYIKITAGKDVPSYLGQYSPKAVIDF